jgi:hypothetical protein
MRTTHKVVATAVVSAAAFANSANVRAEMPCSEFVSNCYNSLGEPVYYPPCEELNDGNGGRLCWMECWGTDYQAYCYTSG